MQIMSSENRNVWSADAQLQGEVDAKMGGITLTVDRLRISGPLIDGGFRLSLDLGEYMAEQVAKLVTLPQQVPLEVTVGLYQRSKGWDGPADSNDSPEAGIEFAKEFGAPLSENPDGQKASNPEIPMSGNPESQTSKNPNHETED
jgi:hypothetical protein